MFKTILLDLDNTILDFSAAEHAAVSKTFREIGLEPTEALIARYSEINQQQWECFERGEITRDTVLVRRFSLLFEELGLPLSAEDASQAVEDIYRGHLSEGHYFIDGAPELLAYLAPKYELYLASNGVADTQYSRLASAGITHYFREIFISETTGHHKPERAYFDYCFAHIPDFDPARALIIGDSLTSDIRGGKNAGIATCWFNPARRENRSGICPDFEVHALSELYTLL